MVTERVKVETSHKRNRKSKKNRNKKMVKSIVKRLPKKRSKSSNNKKERKNLKILQRKELVLTFTSSLKLISELEKSHGSKRTPTVRNCITRRLILAEVRFVILQVVFKKIFQLNKCRMLYVSL